MNQLKAFQETVKLAEQHMMPTWGNSELGLNHLRTMLTVVEKEDFSEAKLGRWLGWAQCAVVAAGIGLDLEDMKEINMRNQ